MGYVVLDTCVLVNCTLMNAEGADPELLVTICNSMRKKGLRLLLPEVVELEYYRKVPELLDNIRQQIKKFRAEITTQVLPGPDVSALHQTLNQLESARESAAARAQEHFSKLAADDGLTVRAPLTGDILAEATAYALAGRKPSKKALQGRVDSDSLIVASLAAFSRSENFSAEETILLCSDNHSDFATWSKEAQRHVVHADIAKAIPCPVRYFKSPRTLVEEELQLNVQADPKLAQALDSYDGLRLTLESISSILKNMPVPNFADLFKNMPMPNYAALFQNMALHAQLSDLQAADSIEEDQDDSPTATDSQEDDTAEDSPGDDESDGTGQAPGRSP